MDYLKDIAAWMPFVGMVSRGSQPSPLATRLTEALIIAIASGMFSAYMVSRENRQSIAQLTHQVVEVKTMVEGMRRDLYVPRGGLTSR